MRLQHTHETDGPVRVTVSASNHPLFITIDSDALYAAVDIVTDDSNAAWAGPTGFRGHGFGVEVGRPSLINSFRGGSYVSGGGTVLSGGRGSVVSVGGISASVRATGRGSIAAGGNISNVATGRGARVTGEQPSSTPEPGVHLTVPEGCTFSLRRFLDISIQRNGQNVPLADAEANGWLEVKR